MTVTLPDEYPERTVHPHLEAHYAQRVAERRKKYKAMSYREQVLHLRHLVFWLVLVIIILIVLFSYLWWFAGERSSTGTSAGSAVSSTPPSPNARGSSNVDHKPPIPPISQEVLEGFPYATTEAIGGQPTVLLHVTHYFASPDAVTASGLTVGEAKAESERRGLTGFCAIADGPGFVGDWYDRVKDGAGSFAVVEILSGPAAGVYLVADRCPRAGIIDVYRPESGYLWSYRSEVREVTE